MKPRTISFIMASAIALAIAFAVPAPAGAFRCGNRLVTEGDSMGSVLVKCGSPDVKHVSRSETHTGYRERTVRVRRNMWVTRGAADSATVQIETWIYNMGENRMTRVLTFEDGILTEIAAGDYGSGPSRFPAR